MIAILFVGDGPRDSVTLPRLVEGILRTDVREQTHHWKELRLNRGSGYARKLLFALRQAKDARHQGLVAVVDGDKDRQGYRLRELCDARDADRSKNPAFPMALGQAVPHGEAWLLDDPVAVRQALGMAGDAPVPNVRKINSPKEELEQLIGASKRADDNIQDILTEVARQVACERCSHAADTGLAKFIDEVKAELGPLAPPTERLGAAN